MSGSSLNLRIASIFIVLTSSLIGVTLPFSLYKVSKDSPLFKCIKTGAAGIMLGIALMHLLPEANDLLLEILPEYNLAFAVTCLGIVINLCLEQFAIIWLESSHSSRENTRENSELKIEFDENGIKIRKPTVTELQLTQQQQHESYQTKSSPSISIEHGEHCGFVKCEHNHTDCDIESSTNHLPSRNESNRGISEDVISIDDDILSNKDTDIEKELIKSLISTQGMRDIITLYAMEISITIHSVIIGVDIGLLTGNNLTTLISLIIAISFHQFIEGLGLGTTFLNSKTKLGNKKVILFITIFSLTTPIGIIIGILTASTKETNVQIAIKGIANSLACGSLLYICLTEMLANYFSSIDLMNRPNLKLYMIACFTIGISFMALLAYWA